jgi:RNA methyltransferase, TrmH family
MKHLTSRDNPFYKVLLKLVSSTKQRKKSALTLLDGAHLLAAYRDAGLHPQQFIVTAAGLANVEVVELLTQFAQVAVTLLDDALFADLSELKTPSGILALIEPIPPKLDVAHSRFCLLLEDVQDPGNLGSMIRSAAAAGCDAVFLSAGCADVWSPKVLRAGMGGHFVLSLHPNVDLLTLAPALQATIHAASLSASSSLYQCDLRGNLAFAIGNEGAGLSAELLSQAHHLIRIPMPSKVESLNAAAAAAVCLFEAVRQRQ